MKVNALIALGAYATLSNAHAGHDHGDADEPISVITAGQSRESSTSSVSVVKPEFTV